MPHVLKMPAIKFGSPVPLIVGFKTYNSTFHKVFQKSLCTDHDEQHFELCSCFNCVRTISG